MAKAGENSDDEFTSNIDSQLQPFVVEELKRDADCYLASGSYGLVNEVNVGDLLRVSK